MKLWPPLLHDSLKRVPGGGWLLKSFSILLAGNIAGNALNLLAMIYLGRRGLDKPQYGIFTALQAGLLLLASLADFGLSTAAIKYHNELTREGKPTAANLLLTRILAIRLALIFIFSLGVLAGARWLMHLFFDQPVGSMVFVWMCVGAVGASTWSYAQTLLQIETRFKMYAAFTFLNHCIRCLLVVLCIAYAHDVLMGAIMIVALVPVFGAAVGLAAARDKIMPLGGLMRPNAELSGAFSNIMRFSKWIFTATIIASFVGRLDVLQLTALSTSEEVGRYGMANNLAQGILMVGATLTTILLPKMATIRSRRRMLQFYKLNLLGLAALIALMPLAIGLNHLVTPWVFGPKYASSVHVFDYLLVAMTISFLGVPLSFFCYAFERTYYLAAVTALQLVIIVLANCLLIPRYGAIGSALALIAVHWISYLFLNVIFFRLLRLAEPA